MENEINYKEEADKLREGQNWFNPDAGKFKVELKSEMTERKTTFDGEERVQGILDVTVKDKEYKWSMNKGETAQSLYGQMLLVAVHAEPKGKLTGKTINLLVKSTTTNDKKKREFTVEEALPFMESKADK